MLFLQQGKSRSGKILISSNYLFFLSQEKLDEKKYVCLNTAASRRWCLPLWDDVDVGSEGSFVAAMQWIEGTNA
jgi:hypothetical protein